IFAGVAAAAAETCAAACGDPWAPATQSRKRARTMPLRHAINLDAVDRRVVDDGTEDEIQDTVAHRDVVGRQHVSRVGGARRLDDLEVRGCGWAARRDAQ